MEKQLLFKEKYVQKLKEEVNADRYSTNEFVYDHEQTLMMANILKPVGLVSKLDPTNDFRTAILVFEAYRNLEPLQASDERFWTYLTHVDLYSYMIKRWDAFYNGVLNDKEGYIRTHWFLRSTIQSELLRAGEKTNMN